MLPYQSADQGAFLIPVAITVSFEPLKLVVFENYRDLMFLSRDRHALIHTTISGECLTFQYKTAEVRNSA